MKHAARLTIVLAVATGACAAPNDGASGAAAEINAGGAGPKLCVALRGNGQSIVTHFASLARIVEHYGVVDGVAGGSSGSISAFVYESILENPAISACSAGPCSEAERVARIALMLKSVQGYGETVAGSDEALAVRDLVKVAARLNEELEAKGIAGLAASDVQLAAEKLTEVLSIPELRAVINPEIFAMLRDTEHLAFNVNEIRASIAVIGKFSVDDNRLFFRRGVLGWDALALLFGRVADFYAGLSGADSGAMRAWLDVCAARSAGKPWDETAAVEAGGKVVGATCGEAFSAIVASYRAKVRANGTVSARLSDRVAATSSPLRKLISTSVLEGAAVPAYQKSLAAYRSGAHPAGSIPFDVRFDDVKFGYWGSDADLATVKASRLADLKSTKMTALGNATWKDILTRSPAEPGISALNDLPDGRISAGGWSDLAPTLVLKSLGCEKVIYVTRQGDEGTFATKIAVELGMTEPEWTALYDLGEPSSSYSASVGASDGVWCTDWDAFGDLQQNEKAHDAYAPPLEARASFDGIRTLKPYDKLTKRAGKPGCTPGLSGGTKMP